MEDLIAGYRGLLRLLEEEGESARRCMSGQFLQSYLALIEQEKVKIQQELRLLYEISY